MVASAKINQLLNGMTLHVAEVHRNNNQANEHKGMVLGSPWEGEKKWHKLRMRTTAQFIKP